MKKLVVFSLLTLLFLSGCGNQPTAPTDTLQAPSQDVNSVTELGKIPYLPKEPIFEKATEVPAAEPLATPKSESTETETVPVPQVETSIATPQEPQHEAEIVSLDIGAEESPEPPVQEETPPQARPEPPEPQ